MKLRKSNVVEEKKPVKNVVNSKVKKQERLVRYDRVADYEKKGWKIVKEDVRDKHKRTLGVKTHSELVLMEK